MNAWTTHLFPSLIILHSAIIILQLILLIIIISTMNNEFKVNYTNPVYGLEMPEFPDISEDDKKFTVNNEDQSKRKKCTIALGGLKFFNFTTDSNGLLCVPFSLLQHKSNKKYFKIDGVYGAERHAEYLLHILRPELSHAEPAVRAELGLFAALVKSMSRDIKRDVMKYLKYWYHSYFQKCCTFVGLEKRPGLQNYTDDLSYVKDNIKACYIMQYTLATVKRTLHYPSNRKLLAKWLMEYRDMFVTGLKKKEDETHRSFAERLISSTLDDFSSRFSGRFGTRFYVGCKWEDQKFKTIRRNTPHPVLPFVHPAHPLIPPPGNLHSMAHLVPAHLAPFPGMIGPNNNHQSMAHLAPAHHYMNSQQILMPAPSVAALPYNPTSASSSVSTMTPTTTVTPATIVPIVPALLSYSGISVQSPPASVNASVNVTPSSFEPIASPGNNSVSSTTSVQQQPTQAKISPLQTEQSIIATGTLHDTSAAPSRTIEVAPAVIATCTVASTSVPPAPATTTVPAEAAGLVIVEAAAAKDALAASKVVIATATETTRAQAMAAATATATPTSPTAVAADLAAALAVGIVDAATMAETNRVEANKNLEVVAAPPAPSAPPAPPADPASTVATAVATAGATQVPTVVPMIPATSANSAAAKVAATEEATASTAAAAKVAAIAVQKGALATATAAKLPVAGKKKVKRVKKIVATPNQTTTKKKNQSGSAAKTKQLLVPAQKKQKLGTYIYCLNHANHPDKVSDYECLIEERALEFEHYGINLETAICKNPSASCCLPKKGSWSKGSRKPILYLCAHCIALKGTTAKEEYVIPFFICKPCYDDIGLDTHPKLPQRHRRARIAKKLVDH
jgi:hypothetical protein